MENQTQNKHTFVRLLTLDAMFIALYVILGNLLSFPLFGMEISWSTLPILLCALMLPLKDALTVAVVGTFLEQLLSPYGLAWNAPLWMLPVILMALWVNLSVYGKERPRWSLILLLVLSELALTALNLGVTYLDAYLLHYEAVVVIPLRLLNGGIRAALSACAIPYLLPPVQRAVRRVI